MNLDWILSLILGKPTPTPQPTSLINEVIAAINVERTSKKLHPLVNDPILCAVAQDWAVEMATHVGMTHGAFGNRISHAFPNHAAGEDIAAGQRTVAEVVKSWMNSPPHRANILGNFDLIGAGESGTTTFYWCLDFVKE